MLFTGPLMVIVEYCKYGNLSGYLKSKRDLFSTHKVMPQLPNYSFSAHHKLTFYLTASLYQNKVISREFRNKTLVA